MVFSSIPFLYYFLPIVLIAYFLVPRKAKNYELLLASLFFYFYGEQLLVLLMLSSALVDYSMARIIEKFRDNKIIPKIALAISLICATLSTLTFLFLTSTPYLAWKFRCLKSRSLSA